MQAKHWLQRLSQVAEFRQAGSRGRTATSVLLFFSRLVCGRIGVCWLIWAHSAANMQPNMQLFVPIRPLSCFLLFPRIGQHPEPRILREPVSAPGVLTSVQPGTRGPCERPAGRRPNANFKPSPGLPSHGRPVKSSIIQCLTALRSKSSVCGAIRD